MPPAGILVMAAFRPLPTKWGSRKYLDMEVLYKSQLEEDAA
jgi:hypothetical protein